MPLPPPGPRRDRAIALLLALLAAVFRFPRLGFPPEEVFDEVYHAKSALSYLQGLPPIDWVHPPTSKLLIAAGVWVLGYDSWGWRMAPALAGTALIAVFYLLARKVLETERAAVLASVLLLCDGVYLVQSRMAMTNIFAVLFQLGTAYFVVKAGLEWRLRITDMLGLGLMLGLALSTRWTSLFAAAFLGPVFLVLRGRRILRPREIFLLFVSFGLMPPAIYMLSYVPLMRQGHSAMEMIYQQAAIWHYHATLNATHPYFSPWYTWPWLYRPTLYYFKVEDGVRGILALGNPALWWASIPVTAWTLWLGVRQKDPRKIFAGAGFYALYLPWGISPRTLNFSHYLFEAIPYACLCLGGLLDRNWSNEGRIPARAYVVVAILLFVFFFPFLTALPIPKELFYWEYHQHRPWWWFPTWI